jgi:hypothetical protein
VAIDTGEDIAGAVTFRLVVSVSPSPLRRMFLLTAGGRFGDQERPARSIKTAASRLPSVSSSTYRAEGR